MTAGIEPIKIFTSSPCYCVSFSPENENILSGHGDSVLRVFKIPGTSESKVGIKPTNEIALNKSAITSIVYSQYSTQNKTFIVNTKDSRVIMMDASTFKPIKIFENLDYYIYPSISLPIGAGFSLTENLILVPNNQGGIAIFEVSDPETVYSKDHPDLAKHHIHKGNHPLFCMAQWHSKTG
jgi:WD40 repeat protein